MRTHTLFGHVIVSLSDAVEIAVSNCARVCVSMHSVVAVHALNRTGKIIAFFVSFFVINSHSAGKLFTKNAKYESALLVSTEMRVHNAYIQH